MFMIFHLFFFQATFIFQMKPDFFIFSDDKKYMSIIRTLSETA